MHNIRKLKNDELNRPELEEFRMTKKIPLVVVLENIRSANNIGSVFRTSDAFLVESIFLTGYTAQPPNKDIHKTALGATESVNWIHFNTTEEAIENLHKNAYKVYAIEQCDKSILFQDFKSAENEKYAVILGNEVRGVEQSSINLCDGCIEIEQFGTKHSLNISVCAGIVIHDLFKQLHK